MTEGLPATESERSDQDKIDDILRFFSDHFVSLVVNINRLDGTGNVVAQTEFFALSGFVVSLQDRWFLPMAGHDLLELHLGLAEKKIQFVSCGLADTFGTHPLTSEPTPFDFEGTERLFVDDAALGVDVGIIFLRDFFRESLRANGIKPITEENWRSQQGVQFDGYRLLGLPRCLIADPHSLRQSGDRIVGQVHQAMVSIESIELPESELPKSVYPWFVGRVKGESRLPSIVGMSGGPIFGFAMGDDGQLRYWAVAIQSRWRRQERIIFGCPIPLFMRALEHAIASIEESS